MSTLTRRDALDLIDECVMLADLAALATDWIGNPSLVEGLSFEDGTDALCDYVDACCDADGARSNGPKDSDDTGIPAEGWIL